jgi:hypothetical protein
MFLERCYGRKRWFSDASTGPEATISLPFPWAVGHGHRPPIDHVQRLVCQTGLLPTHVKIDVEGFEGMSLKVLKGIARSYFSSFMVAVCARAAPALSLATTPMRLRMHRAG